MKISGKISKENQPNKRIMVKDIMVRISINQATTMNTDFATDVKAYSKAGIKAIEIWLPKLEKYLEVNSLAEVKNLLNAEGVRSIGACSQGDLMLSEGKQREKILDMYQRKLEICKVLSIPILVVPTDFPSKVKESDYSRAVNNLRQVGEIADKFNVSLAVEFIARAKSLGSLSTTNQIIRNVGLKNVGILLDTFHFYVGISKMSDIGETSSGDLFLVHINDTLDKPRELLTDSDRVFLGEGTMPLEEIVRKLKSIGYSGFYSLELFNQRLWEENPYQVAQKCFHNLTKYFEKKG